MGKGDGQRNRLSISEIKHHSHLEYTESTRKAGDILFVKYLPFKYYFTEHFWDFKQDRVSEMFRWVNRTICPSGLCLNGNEKPTKESSVMFDY